MRYYYKKVMIDKTFWEMRGGGKEREGRNAENTSLASFIGL